LLWGLGVAVHPVLLFLAPLWLTVRRDRWPVLLGGCLLGLVPYGLLPLRGPWPQPWGDLRTLGGWWTYVSARLYHGYVFALPAAEWPRRLLAWTGTLARQFTPLGMTVALWGLSRAWVEDRLSRLGPLLALLLVSVYALGYNTTDSQVYLAPFLPLLALWLGDGVASLTVYRIPVALWLLLPALLLVVNWGAMDLSSDRTPRRWAEERLVEAPPKAVLVTSRDAHTFTLWYAQAGLGLRPDVVVVDRDLWAWPSYRAFLRRTGWTDIAGPEAPGACEVTADALHCP
jgi:hypothetical protein